MHDLASQTFRVLPDAYPAGETPSPRSTKYTPLAGHAIQIFFESEDSITSYNLPDPDIFAMRISWFPVEDVSEFPS